MKALLKQAFIGTAAGTAARAGIEYHAAKDIGQEIAEGKKMRASGQHQEGSAQIAVGNLKQQALGKFMSPAGKSLTKAIGTKGKIEGRSAEMDAASVGQGQNRNAGGSNPQEKSASVDLSPSSKRRLEDTKRQLKQLLKEAGLEKRADDDSYAGTLARNTAGAVGIGAGLAATQAGIQGAAKKYKEHKKNKELEKTWDTLQEEHPNVANEETRDHYDVLKDYAPDLAQNPTVAKSYLERAQQLGRAPHEFVQDLVGTQSDIDRSNQDVDVSRALSTGANLAKSSSQNDSVEALEEALKEADPR